MPKPTSTTRVSRTAVALLFCSTAFVPVGSAHGQQQAETAAGFQGIWYSIGHANAYGPKYSGGMSTYPQQHAPIAIYSAEANKTFFTYADQDPADGSYRHAISYFDHETGMVARPRIWLDTGAQDGHDNPVLSIDDEGYVWMFSNTHGNNRRSYIRRSADPFSINAYEGKLSTHDPQDTAVFGASTRFSYGQPWFVPDNAGGGAFLFLHTRYNGADRDLYWTTSDDGDTWSPATLLAQMEGGQYQVSWLNGQTLGTAFNLHPRQGVNGSPAGLDSRTNLYYLQTDDLGKTWRTADGTAITAPLTDADNPALVHDYRSEGRLVYLKDVNYDSQGRPVLLYLTSAGHSAGPDSGPRIVHTAHWTGEAWEIQTVTHTDHNYDHGSLYIEQTDDGNEVWRVIAPFLDGPQQWGTGGEIGMWISEDQGASWTLIHELTAGSERNHSYVRRPLNAHEDFYAFWSDGNAFEASESDLFFADKAGNVYRLPREMEDEFAAPELVFAVPEPASAALLLGGMLAAFRR